jgi:hypothetical protein
MRLNDLNFGVRVFGEFLFHTWLLLYVTMHHPALQGEGLLLDMWFLILGMCFVTVLFKRKWQDVVIFIFLFVVTFVMLFLALVDINKFLEYRTLLKKIEKN